MNFFFALLRFLLFRSSCTRNTYLLYFFLSSPALAIEFWLEKIGRPIIASSGEVKRSGEDLEAKGLTEYLWDVLYWSWACTFVAAVFGNKAWWAWSVIPLYSVWLAWTTFGGMRHGLAGMAGQQGGADSTNGGATSNRQKKMEKRGGQKVQYR